MTGPANPSREPGVQPPDVTEPALALTPSDRVTEPDLIARVLAGDRLAARALYDAHVGRVHRLAHRMTGDAQLAREVTQDTFVKALSNLGQFRGDAQFTTWLHRITVSAALNAMRRVKRLHGRETPIEDLDLPAGGGDGEGAGGIDPIVRDRLHRAIDALPEIYRTTVIMHEFEGYSHIEIAEALGVAVGTCKSRLFAARAQLRAALRDLEGEIHG
jgi:RNA polymerase sigma-70 factor, ECF subfamily